MAPGGLSESMTSPNCEICLQKPVQLACGLCSKGVCKACHVHFDSQAFSFMSKVPEKLSKGSYCLHCYDAEIEPVEREYEKNLESAKDIYFLTKNYPGNIRVLRRHTKRVKVDDCPDRRETILRMAFFAVELGFNAIIEADLKSEKGRMGAYQSASWCGSALPANIDGPRLEAASLRRI
jgi:hypothetical protein